MLIGLYFFVCVIRFSRHLNINQIDGTDAVNSQGNFLHPVALIPDSIARHIIFLVGKNRQNVLLFYIAIPALAYIGGVILLSWLLGLAFNRPHEFWYGFLVYIVSEMIIAVILGSYFFWKSIKKTSQEVNEMEESRKRKIQKGEIEDANSKSSLMTFMENVQSGETID